VSRDHTLGSTREVMANAMHLVGATDRISRVCCRKTDGCDALQSSTREVTTRVSAQNPKRQLGP
jgi:hypothetical protein